MTGRRNREKGNEYEVELTHYLSPRLDVEVRTSRDGRGGAQGGADLVSCDAGTWVPHVRGWTVEAKHVAASSVPTWLRQARDAATVVGTEWWCVIHRTRGTSDRGTDRVYLPTRMLLDFLIHEEPTVLDYDVDDYLCLTLSDWCEVAS